jgi:protoporphyrinogen IX oxidase
VTAWTLVFHMIGLVFWIGGLLIVTITLARHAQEPSLDARLAFGKLEKKLMNVMATPGVFITVISGVILIATNPSYYLHAGWLHAKLALVVVLIGLHWVVHTRTKSFAAGRIELQRRECITLHISIALLFVGILILVLPGQVYMK